MFKQRQKKLGSALLFLVMVPYLERLAGNQYRIGMDGEPWVGCSIQNLKRCRCREPLTLPYLTLNTYLEIGTCTKCVGIIPYCNHIDLIAIHGAHVHLVVAFTQVYPSILDRQATRYRVPTSKGRRGGFIKYLPTQVSNFLLSWIEPYLSNK